MKNIKSRIVAIMLVMFVSFSCGCKNDEIQTGKVMKEETSYAYVVSGLGGDVMPIMSYIAPMGEVSIDGAVYPSSITDSVYSKLQNLGVNLVDGIGFYGNDEWTKKNLEMCDKYSMGALIGAGSWYSSFADRFYKDGKLSSLKDMSETQRQAIINALFGGFEKWAAYDCFEGINYTDELGIAAAPSIKEAQDIFLAKYPDKLFLNNCVGGGAVAATMQYNGFTAEFAEKAGLTTTDIAKKIQNGWGWDAYIESFISTVKPQVFSYDDYPWRSGMQKITPKFLTELENAAKYSSMYKAAFWNFIQTGKWIAAEDGDKCRQPTYNEFAYQINASLAFGAQGIECFLISPVGTEGGPYSGDTLNGRAKFVFDLNGNTTELYEPLKKVFDSVKTIDDVLMRSVWKGVMETESLELKMNAIQTLSEGYALKSFNQVSAIESDSSYYIAGCFNYGGHTALYVFNANTDKTLDGTSDVTVRFSRKSQGYSIFGGNKSEFKSSSYTVKNVAPGEAALIVIE